MNDGFPDASRHDHHVTGRAPSASAGAPGRATTPTPEPAARGPHTVGRGIGGAPARA